jgi:hypothetical protein
MAIRGDIARLSRLCCYKFHQCLGGLPSKSKLIAPPVKNKGAAKHDRGFCVSSVPLLEFCRTVYLAIVNPIILLYKAEVLDVTLSNIVRISSVVTNFSENK